MFTHIPTGKTFENRLQAKIEMGSSRYNRAVKNREFTFHDGRKVINIEESTDFIDGILKNR